MTGPQGKGSATSIERLEAGESGTALGLELSIKRTIIYRWRDQWRQGGTAALRGKPGPRTKEEALAYGNFLDYAGSVTRFNKLLVDDEIRRQLDPGREDPHAPRRPNAAARVA